MKPGLIENDVRAVADSVFLVRCKAQPLDPSRVAVIVLLPERDLHDMEGFLHELAADAEAVKDLDGPGLDAVGFANSERTRALLEDLEVDPVAGQPGSGAEASRATAANQDVGSPGVHAEMRVAMCGANVKVLVPLGGLDVSSRPAPSLYQLPSSALYHMAFTSSALSPALFFVDY